MAMSFPWSMKKSGRKSPEEVTRHFQSEIERLDDLLYGVALLFEGISLLFAGQDNLIETYRKQFRNVIRAGKNVSQQASDLLLQSKTDADKLPLMEQFSFALFEKGDDPGGILKRAEMLIRAYKKLFPDRPRSQPFTEEETFRLMEEAGESLAGTTAQH
jgi:hypothetical protein